MLIGIEKEIDWTLHWLVGIEVEMPCAHSIMFGHSDFYAQTIKY